MPEVAEQEISFDQSQRPRDPGEKDVVKLKHKLSVEGVMFDSLTIRRRCDIGGLTAVQLAYRRAGVPLNQLEVIAAIISQDLLATQTLIDYMCGLEPGTAATLDEVDDYFEVANAIRPFCWWASAIRLPTGKSQPESSPALDGSLEKS